MRVGMVSTRFGGLDGVTLESSKIAELLVRQGHEVCWFSGHRDPGFSPGITVAEAHFKDTEELDRQGEYFGSSHRRNGLIEEIQAAASHLSTGLRGFVNEFDVDVLMAQNALAIPMQVPLAMAITDVVAEGIPAIAHHHDFRWERARFSPTSIGELLDAYFPPRTPDIEHWVINSVAQGELARRKGIAAAVLPNVMDFANPPNPGDPGALRQAVGVGAATKILLQPTRVIPRKSIETTIDLAARLASDCTVVVTHEDGDEGPGYGSYVRAHADALGVDLRFVVADGDGGGPTLADAYAAADLVVYPSRIEGFGNALLEAFYYRRPVVVRRYSVYAEDIGPKGVRCIEFAEQLTESTVSRAQAWVDEPHLWREAVESNYLIGLRYFSMEAAGEVVDRTMAAVAADRA